MKLTYRGKFKKDKLPIADLPKDAKKFKEPENELKLNLVASLFLIPTITFIVCCVLVKSKLVGINEISISFLGLLLSCVTIVPHEFIHALCFPKEAEIHMFSAGWGMCVGSTHPISKRRFIIMSLAPNLIFGFIPLIIWIFMPVNSLSDTIFTFAAISLSMGVGDYMNIFNAITQMPKGSIQQLSGFNSYWYIP